jgi:hypothetical protein
LNNLALGSFLLNVSLAKTFSVCCICHFWSCYQAWEREPALLGLPVAMRHSRIVAGPVRELLGRWKQKNPSHKIDCSGVTGCMRITCSYASARCWAIGYETKPFATVTRRGKLFPKILKLKHKTNWVNFCSQE